jgi:hypothetical protein
VDLLFRGTRVTPCGGEVAWSPDSSGLYLVASTRCLKRIQQKDRADQKKQTQKKTAKHRPKKKKNKKNKKKHTPKTVTAKRPTPPLLRGSSVLLWQPLKGNTQTVRLADGAETPDCPKQINTLYRDLVAYADPKGVWLLHRTSGKRRLIAHKARLPRWSSRGHLLVHYPEKMVVLRLYPRLLQEIAQ